MNIKTDKFYNSDLSLEELQRVEKRLEDMVRKSQQAISKTDDWRYQSTHQHQLYKEVLENKERMPIGNKTEVVQSINTLQILLKGKGATLKGTKELIKNREELFINKGIQAGISKAESKKIARSKEFYDFLHSDEYKKLSASVGHAGSPTLIDQYLLHKDNAISYFKKLISDKEDNPGEITYKELEVPEEFL